MCFFYFMVQYILFIKKKNVSPHPNSIPNAYSGMHSGWPGKGNSECVPTQYSNHTRSYTLAPPLQDTICYDDKDKDLIPISLDQWVLKAYWNL